MLRPVIPKTVQEPVRQLLGRSVHLLQAADEQGEFYHPRGRAKLALALNRALIERGARAPWMWSAERCRRFWADIERGDDSNAPNGYAAKPTEVVDFMHDFWRPDVAPDERVLEMGCNAGANLARLHQLGYSNLSGVEINPHAIAVLRGAFPDLAESMTMHRGSIEDVLPRLDTDAVDVLFTMGVLIHVHPASNWIFAEMVRVAARHICVIETEQAVSHYVFCRDYSRVFERLGCRQLRSVEIGRSSHPELAEANFGATARLFRVPSA
jgi:SAM-dependent methyltransferase